MTALIAAVFFASLMGSTHCAGMCGAFAAFAATGEPHAAQGAWSRSRLVAAYNVGRLFTYLALGAAAGVLGAALNLGGSFVGLSRAAAFAAGGIMILAGLFMLLRALGVRTPRSPLRVPKPWARFVAGGQQRIMRFAPPVRSLLTGTLTTLLPCGWLYAFVLTAAGTGSPLAAMASMAAFWCGTLPVLAALGLGIQQFIGRGGRGWAVAASLAIVVAGACTLVSRAPLDAAAVFARQAQAAGSHGIPDANVTPACCELTAALQAQANQARTYPQ